MSPERPCPVLVLGFGNRSRGDDALGPLLLDGLSTDLPGNIELLEDMQLQNEHAIDLKQRRLALFVHAAIAMSTGFHFGPVHAANDLSHSSHALSPSELLANYRRLFGPPPDAFLLAIGGKDFELGSDLSQEAAQNLDAALHFCRTQLLTTLRMEVWLDLSTKKIK